VSKPSQGFTGCRKPALSPFSVHGVIERLPEKIL
jgi:hypothetical protein